MSEDLTPTRTPIRVVVVDDHAVVRSGLKALLDAEPDLEVVAEAADTTSAERCVRGYKPDVLVLDLNLPGETGLDAVPRLLTHAPATRIVVLTMQNEPRLARQALQAGATGYVLKDAANSELVLAVRRAARGEHYLDPQLGAAIAAEPEYRPPGNLSPRELDVLRLIALGHTSAEIAQQLFLSIRTVEAHRAHINEKLGFSTRAELVRFALTHRLIDE